MCLGVPGKVLFIDSSPMRMGRVSFGGIVKEVCLAYVPEAHLHDFVIVHAGFGISVVNADEAARTLQYLDALGQTVEETPS